MAIRLLFFAGSAQWVSRRELTLPWEGPTTISTLLGRRPELEPIARRRAGLKAAINSEFADFNQEVNDGDEIAFLPPVSGG